ncbi:3-deoxy-D-manno-octulosonic acid transferase [Roseovarius nanhaiticus]|uniref:3-deoxy-D-manno-octulosonic acid transferase n=1 Tax=Roseovarius nanhaiticus TaxID=573024 RepID=UPI0024908826|nr:3-deoxy-D-manno-octulosonic acid transferase [Roseovarius nanhaiticus]
MSAAPGRPTPLVRAYALAARGLAPLAYRRSLRKLAENGMDAARIAERMGHSAQPRPEGRLVWFHAASVGESLSVLRLIEHLGETHKALNFLITTGTATSARIIAGRMPPRCRHQFAPLDSPAAVARFLDHWRPDAGVFVESELWPNMLRGAAARGIPLALLNARISDRSARGWARIGGTARYLLGHFRMVHCQDARTAVHLRSLGCTHAAEGVNLKAMAGPLPHDAGALDALQNELGARPVWVMASTHPGEDEIAIAAHRAVLERHPEALMILVPRHPERAGDIAALAAKAGLSTARRSTNEVIGKSQVYLADTLGEMGLWYRLAPLVCVGGSFVPVGGHNPYEVAHGGAAVLHGPLYANFADGYAQMDAAGAAREVADANELGAAIAHLFAAPEDLNAIRARATAFAAAQEDKLSDLASTLCAALAVE